MKTPTTHPTPCANCSTYIEYLKKAANVHKRINGNNELYHRLSSWMADLEDPSLLQESFEDGPLTVEAFGNYMLDEAMQLMYDIYQTCEDRASTFGGPHDEDGNYWANQLEEPGI